MIKQHWFTIPLIGVLLLSLGAMLTPMLSLSRMTPRLTTFGAQPQPHAAVAEAANALQLVGDYSGEVKLQFTAVGVYSDTLALPPSDTDTPDMGSIDLALNLNQNNTALNGYVSLDKTLVFAVAHTVKINNITTKIGPHVTGSFDGSKLTLLSEKVSGTLSGKPIQRQFRLTGTISGGDDSRFSGEYRETIWGSTQKPITVVGAFTLRRPVFDAGAPAAPNAAPATVADSVTTSKGKAISINVLANDRDANGDSLTITAVSRPQFGSASTNGQSVTYTPNAGFVGQDSFSYFVSDGHGNTTAGSVNVTVDGSGGQSGSATLYLPLMQR